MDSKKISGIIESVGEMKSLGPSGKLKSVGIRLENDSSYHNVTEFSEESIKTILGDITVGDKVTLEEQQVKGYWNVKRITKGIEAKEGTDVKDQNLGSFNIDDRYNPIGSLYGMAEEKLNAIIEQNAFTGTKIDKLMALVLKIAEKNSVDLGFTKAVDELDG